MKNRGFWVWKTWHARCRMESMTTRTAPAKLPPLVQAAVHHLPLVETQVRNHYIFPFTISRSFRTKEGRVTVTVRIQPDPQSETMGRDAGQIQRVMVDLFRSRGFDAAPSVEHNVGGNVLTVLLTRYYGNAFEPAPPPAAEPAPAV